MNKQKSKMEVDALVVKTEKEDNGELGYRYYTTFQYSVDGKQYKTRCESGDGAKGYQKGTVVKIYCYKKDYSEVFLPSMIKFHRLVSITIVAIGILFICIQAFSLS